MTPACSTCGYVVDYLRSCYSSQWRLTSDPTVLTPGRYVFTPAGAPVLPFPHVYGSRNWTTEERRWTPSTVGEVDPPTHRPYRKGTVPVAFPPAVQIGDGPCLQGGAKSPAEAGTLHLVAGFPSACWSAAGMIPPGLQPVLWLRPDELQRYADGEPVSLWIDASPEGHDALYNGLGPALLPDVQGGQVLDAIAGNTAGMLANLPVVLPGDFAIYLVASVAVLGAPLAAVSILQGPAGVHALYVGHTLMRTGQIIRPLASQVIPDLFGSPTLYSLRRTGGQVTFRVNGTVYQAIPVPPFVPFSSTSVVPTLFGQGTGVTSNLFEVRVYAAAVDDATDSAIVAALNARYHIF